MRVSLRRHAEFFLFRLIVCLIECLPLRTSVRMAESFAWFLHYVLPRKLTRYHVSRENLRRAFGESPSEAWIDRTVYRMWVHLFRMVIELVQAPRKLHRQTYHQICQFVDLSFTNECILSGRRVLLLGGHFGNWEVANGLFGVWGFPMGVVARQMDNPLLDDWFRRYREGYGHRLLQKKGDFDDLLELLKSGGNVALLGDQDAGSRGLFVDFFGHPASTFKSIALLALEYDALIMVGAAIRQPDDFTNNLWARFEVDAEDVIDPRDVTSANPVGEITQRFTSALEQLIRRAPEQYFWVHRRWKSEPRSRKSATAQRLAG
ncbi:MAG: lysophospholipid acyltransferase family protein [Planctomycetaceae bacterium]|nr:lysophospholipid acyltransferase family protein [Planctomycetaceae bacterium]